MTLSASRFALESRSIGPEPPTSSAAGAGDSAAVVSVPRKVSVPEVIETSVSVIATSIRSI